MRDNHVAVDGCLTFGVIIGDCDVQLQSLVEGVLDVYSLGVLYGTSPLLSRGAACWLVIVSAEWSAAFVDHVSGLCVGRRLRILMCEDCRL